MENEIVNIELPVRRPQVRSECGEYECECGNTPRGSGFSPARYLGRGKVETFEHDQAEWDEDTWFCYECGGVFSARDVRPVAA